MDGLVYIVWVSIPLVLVFFALLVKLRLHFDESPEADRKKPRRLFRLANAFALYAATCVIIDHFFLLDLTRWLPDHRFSSHEIGLARIGLLPVVAIVGSFLVLCIRIVFPRRGFDRLQMEVRGSSPLLLFIGLAVIAFFIWERGESLRSNPPAPYSQHTVSGRIGTAASSSEESMFFQERQTIPTPHTAAKPRSALGSLGDNTSTFLSEIKSMVGLSPNNAATAPEEPVPTAIPGERADYNPEGNVTYGPVAQQIALEEGVPPLLVQAIIEISSGYNLRWEGAYGHKGLMGLRPDIVAAQGGRDVINAYQNIRLGCRELKRILDEQKTDTLRAIALYRSGSAGLTMTGKISSENNTDDFVRRVMAIFKIGNARDQQQQQAQ